jgi:hypothetical protein
MELLKACKRCENRPRFSSYMFSYHISHAVVCCSTISDKTKELAVFKWNNFNAEAKNTFKLNLETNEWELYKP